ncbi:MAG: hypothetical protein ACKOEM_13045, partial [Planctomycetia bacterium]
ALLPEGLGVLDQVDDAADGWVFHGVLAVGFLQSGPSTAARRADVAKDYHRPPTGLAGRRVIQR